MKIHTLHREQVVPHSVATVFKFFSEPTNLALVTPPHPYSFWHHRHSFVEAPGGTTIIDDIRYVVPFGPLGTLINAVLIRPRLRGIFDYRARVIADLFGNNPERNVHILFQETGGSL